MSGESVCKMKPIEITVMIERFFDIKIGVERLYPFPLLDYFNEVQMMFCRTHLYFRPSVYCHVSGINNNCAHICVCWNQ